MHVYVRSRADIIQLKAHRTFKLFPFGATLQFHIHGLPHNESTIFEKKLARLYNSCGCESGALAAFCAGVGYLIYCILTSQISWMCALYLPMIFVGSGIIGKAAGLLIMKYRLLKLLSNISSRLPS